MGWSTKKHNERTREIRQGTGSNQATASQKAYQEALSRAHRNDEQQQD